MRGFYVDLRDDGSVRQPSEEVTEAEARGQVARVREVLEIPGPLNTAGFLEWLADLPAGLAAEARQFFGRSSATSPKHTHAAARTPQSGQLSTRSTGCAKAARTDRTGRRRQGPSK